MGIRNRNLNVRVTDEELAMLAAIAEREGISASDWLRLRIRGAYREVFGEGRPRKRNRKK